MPSGKDAVKRERRQMHLGGKFRISMDPAPDASTNAQAGAAVLSSADDIKINRIVECAFGLFKKIIPCEPFSINIFNLQVQFDEALPSSQRRLSFQPQPRTSQLQDSHAKPTQPPVDVQ